MSEVEDLRGRAEAVRRAFAAMPASGWGEPGPPDPRTGERWDRGHALGHVAAMLPYWTAQVRAVLAGADVMGRDEAGMAARRAAIEGSHETGEDALLARIDAGLAGVQTLLAGMRDEDMGREATLNRPDGTQSRMTLRELVDSLLVGHAEEHVRQLAGNDR
jgi:hypothetical protein